jgi:hypothetical protein
MGYELPKYLQLSLPYVGGIFGVIPAKFDVVQIMSAACENDIMASEAFV